VRDDADDDLDRHEPDNEQERDREVPPIRIGADAMRMRRTRMVVVIVTAVILAAVPAVRVVAHVAPPRQYSSLLSLGRSLVTEIARKAFYARINFTR